MKVKISILFSLIIFMSCKSDYESCILPAYNIKEKIINCFSNKTLAQNRGQNLLITYFCDTNEFEVLYNTLEKKIDSISNQKIVEIYNHDCIFFNANSVLGVKDSIKKEVTELLYMMTEHQIACISSEVKQSGIDLQLYLYHGMMLYIADTNNIKIPMWINYYKEFIPIDDNWYYKIDE